MCNTLQFWEDGQKSYSFDYKVLTKNNFQSLIFLPLFIKSLTGCIDTFDSPQIMILLTVMLKTFLSLIETNNSFLYGQFANNDLKQYSYISQNLFRYPANTYLVLPVIVYFTTDSE